MLLLLGEQDLEFALTYCYFFSESRNINLSLRAATLNEREFGFALTVLLLLDEEEFVLMVPRSTQPSIRY